MKKIVVAGCLSVAAVFAVANASADDWREVERSASVFHSYEFEETKDTPAPEGFRP